VKFHGTCDLVPPLFSVLPRKIRDATNSRLYSAITFSCRAPGDEGDLSTVSCGRDSRINGRPCSAGARGNEKAGREIIRNGLKRGQKKDKKERSPPHLLSRVAFDRALGSRRCRRPCNSESHSDSSNDAACDSRNKTTSALRGSSWGFAKISTLRRDYVCRRFSPLEIQRLPDPPFPNSVLAHVRGKPSGEFRRDAFDINCGYR